MPLPADAIQLSSDTESKLPADAVPISQMDQGSDNYSEMQPVMGGSQAGQGEVNPASIKESFLSSLPRTPEARVLALQGMNPNADIQLSEDKKTVLLNGQDIGSIHNPVDVVKALARFTAHNLPVIGQAVAVGLAPEVGLPAMMGISALGAIGGSAIQQAGAQAVSGEKPSLGEGIYQGAMGAAAPPVGLLLGKGVELTGKMVAPVYNKLVTGLQDSFPEVAETLLNISKGNATRLMERVKSGVKVKNIINETTASPEVPADLAKRVIYGTEGSAEDVANFIKGRKLNIRDAQTLNEKNAVNDFYSANFPKLSKDAIEGADKFSVDELTNPTLTADNAFLNEGKKIKEMLVKGEGETFNKEFASAVSKLYKGGEKTQIDISDDVYSMLKQLGPRSAENPNGVNAILENNGEFIVNSDYGTLKERKVIQEFIDRFKNTSGMSSEQRKIMALAYRNKANIQMGGQTVVPDEFGFFTKLPASKAYDIMRGLNPIKKAIFEMGGESAKPIEGFVKSVTNKIGQLNPELVAINAKWAKFSDLEGMLGNINAEGTLKRAFSTGELRTVAKELDSLLGTKVTPQIQKLGTAQELKEYFDGRGFEIAKNKFMTKLKAVNNLKDPRLDEIRRELVGLDSVIKRKFLTEAENHSIASEIMNNKMSLFRARALAFIISSAFTHNPLVSLPLGFAAGNPRNAMKVINMFQSFEERGGMAGLNKSVSKTATSKVGQAALGKLLRLGAEKKN